MSSVSFPHSGHVSSVSSSSINDSRLYEPSFDGTSGFQMNPLSSHPPRTPRTSLISTGSYSLFESKEEELEKTATQEEDLEDEEEDKLKDSQSRVRKEEVWREIVSTSNGRDKAFKLIQYSIRVYLLFHTAARTSTLLRRPTQQPWEESLVKRLTSTMSGLSFSRKLLLLFNWLAPLAIITGQQSVPFSAEKTAKENKKMTRPFLQSVLYAPPPVLLELVHALADDAYTLSLLGLFGKKTGERAGRFSDWCWFLATLVGLVENGVERGMIGQQQREVESRAYSDSVTGATAKSQPKNSKVDEKELARLHKEDFWLQITRAKLVMDLIFVSYDLFQIKRAREPVKAFSGLAAAILSSAKLYHRHKVSLAKALTL